MRILLVSSNIKAQFPRCFPNGTAALSAFLKREGFDVRMLHFASLKEINRLPVILQEYEPDVVGFSIMTCESVLLPQTTAMVKAWKPTVPVVCGGTHVIVNPQAVLSLPNVDAICHGEGELAFLEYLQKLQRGMDVTDVQNFWFKRDGQIIQNPPRAFIEDLNTLPFMDRSQGDYQQKAIDANNGAINLLLGRGCNWNCRFCCNAYIRKANTGTYVRNRRVEVVCDEIVEVSKKFDFRWITIRDDNFVWDREWAIAFCREYAKRLKYPFEIFARADCLDEELMNELKGAGCYSIFIGLDAGHDYIRNQVLNKEQSNEDLLRVCRYMKSIGIHPVISNIVGLPYETREMHQATIDMNREIYNDGPFFSPSFGATPKIWVFDPWPGTELYETCKREGWLQTDERRHKVYRQSCLNMPQFPPAEINRAFRRFRYEVFKDRFPVRAWLYRIYDTRLVEETMEHIPLEYIGQVREVVLKIMNRATRRLLGRNKLHVSQGGEVPAATS